MYIEIILHFDEEEYSSLMKKVHPLTTKEWVEYLAKTYNITTKKFYIQIHVKNCGEYMLEYTID